MRSGTTAYFVRVGPGVLAHAAPHHPCFLKSRLCLELIKKQKGRDGTEVVHLIKSIQKTAEGDSDDPFLTAMAERVEAVPELFEDRQTSTADALAELLTEIEKDQQRKKEQVAKRLDGLS